MPMDDTYTNNIFEEDEDLFFEQVIQEDFELLEIDMLLRLSFEDKKS